jgi:hypothetical protein
MVDLLLPLDATTDTPFPAPLQPLARQPEYGQPQHTLARLLPALAFPMSVKFPTEHMKPTPMVTATSIPTLLDASQATISPVEHQHQLAKPADNGPLPCTPVLPLTAQEPLHFPPKERLSPTTETRTATQPQFWDATTDTTLPMSFPIRPLARQPEYGRPPLIPAPPTRVKAAPLFLLMPLSATLPPTPLVTTLSVPKDHSVALTHMLARIVSLSAILVTTHRVALKLLALQPDGPLPASHAISTTAPALHPASHRMPTRMDALPDPTTKLVLWAATPDTQFPAVLLLLAKLTNSGLHHHSLARLYSA